MLTPHAPRSRALHFALPLLAMTLAAQEPQGPPPGSGPPDGFGPGSQGGPGGPMQRGDLEVLAKFDADNNGRLDVEERKDARAWLKDNRPRRGGPGGPGGRGGPPMGDGEAQPATARVGVTVRSDEVEHHEGTELFDPFVVRTIFLQFAAADWFEELNDFYRTDVDIPATVTVDGKAYAGVGVHMRGNTSYQMVRTKKKSLHLDFDFTVADQKLLGHASTNLINNHEDPSLLHEVIGAFVANQHTHAPRACLVRVVANGEDLGVYSHVEHFGKDFLEEHFGSKKGTRWKVPPDFSGNAALKDLGDDDEAWRRAYTIKSKDDATAWQKLRALCTLLATASDAELERELPQQLDVDGALWFLACDNALLDGDGYYSRGSDYVLWLDGDDRFHVLPRDGNEVLGGGGGPRGRRGGPAGPGAAGGPPGGDAPQGGNAGGPPRGDRPPQGRPPGERGDGARSGQGQQGQGQAPGPQGPGGRRGRGGMRMPTVDQNALAMQNDENRPLIRRLLGIPAWRERYLGYLRTLVHESLHPDVLRPRLVQWRLAIEEVARVDAHALDGFDAFVQAHGDGPRALRTILTQRHQKLAADPALQGPWPVATHHEHAFVGQPTGPQALRITVRTSGATAATLHVSQGKLGPFTEVAMFDDGQHGDGDAEDGTFGVKTDAFPPRTTVRWFVAARNAKGRVACAPSAGGGRPAVVTVPGEKAKKTKDAQKDDGD